MSTSESTSCRPAADVPARWPVHPLLLAVCPILSLFVANLGEVFPSDIWLPLGLALAGATLLTLIARLATDTWERAAMIASYVVVLFFGFQLIHKAIFIVTGLIGLPLLSLRVYLWLWGLALLAGSCLLLRWPRNSRRATMALNAFALLLLSIVLVTSVGPAYRLWQSRLRLPADAPIPLQVREDSPDIYYLIFDRYASLPTLERDFGFDNRPFYRQLRERGFYCAGESHANYPRTKISMASALNLRLLENPVDDDHVSLLYHHRVGRSLCDAGYNYFHLGSWYGPLRFNGDANYTWSASGYPSYFAQALCLTTPLAPLFQWANGQAISHVDQPQSAALTEAKFEEVKKISKLDGHKFVYAHFLLPHPPFLFNADGSRTTPHQVSGRTTEQNYAEQLAYANRRILELVDAIAANSQRPPIIVIQADEGPLLSGADVHKSRAERARKRTGIISAFLLPGREAAKLIAPDITPVNTFRVIFSSYFAANLPELPNRVFYWEPADTRGLPDPAQSARAVDVTEELVRETTVAAH